MRMWGSGRRRIHWGMASRRGRGGFQTTRRASEYRKIDAAPLEPVGASGKMRRNRGERMSNGPIAAATIALAAVIALMAGGDCTTAADTQPASLPSTREIWIVPRPVSVVREDGFSGILSDTRIEAIPATAALAESLAGMLRPATGYPFPVEVGDG